MLPAKRFKRDYDLEHDMIEAEDTEPEVRTFIEVFSFPFTNIYQDISQDITNTTDFEALEVNDVPSISDAVNLIASDVLRRKFYQTSYSITIRLKIINEITTLSPLQYEIISTKIDKTRKLLLCLESQIDKKCCFYWKCTDDSPLMMLSLIDVDIAYRSSMNFFVYSVLLLALRFGNDGLSEKAKLMPSTDLSLFSLADVNDKNLLMLAADTGNRPVVEDLIKIGFDVNFQVDNLIAADLAWQNRHLDVLLSLLEANSLYPVEFNDSNTSTEIKDFVRMTSQFLKSVKSNDEASVKQILERHPNLRYFYDRDNVSAAFTALSKEKFNIYRIFMMNNVCVGPKEDIEKIFTKFTQQKREELRQIHLEHSREPPEKYLMILHSNISVGHDTIDVNEKLNHAKSAIEYLCRISIIKLILQVVAASRNFKIIFDFNRDSVQFLDPTSSKQTRGSFFTSRQIYIAAKFLLDPQRRHEAYGTLAHELCHFAMYLVYKNNCLPYFEGDKQMANEFHRCLKHCHENRRREDIIRCVFEYPKENHELRHSELIVRVPHLLALYHENQEYLEELRELFFRLFSFFQFKVVEDMKAALPNIETEGDGEVRRFNDKRKRKGFCRMRNLVIMILIASAIAVGVLLLVYFMVLKKEDGELVGEVNKPWNTIIRNSRTKEFLCIGSLFHREFVLTTAECVFKKRHIRHLPPELFTVDLPYLSKEIRTLKVIEIKVIDVWNPFEDHLSSDWSILRIESVLKFDEDLYPVNLPPQIEISDQSEDFNILQFYIKNLQFDIEKSQVLHTFMGEHSFNVPVTKIDTTECILEDYTLNAFLGVYQYCGRQLENKYCVSGHGEQFYDVDNNVLHGLVSMGHRTEADCAKNNSLIITELGYYSDLIRKTVCNGRFSIDYREGDDWRIRSKMFEFVPAILEKSSGKLICWSIYITNRTMITDSNCLNSYSPKDVELYRYNTALPPIQSFERNPSANITKIILTSDSDINLDIGIPYFENDLEDLELINIVYDYDQDDSLFTSRYYLYWTPEQFNSRVFSNFCVQVPGGPVFIGSDKFTYYGIVTKEECNEECDIGDNGFKVGYVKLYDHLKWIYGVPDELPSNTTTRSTTPSFTPNPMINSIAGEFSSQDYCNNDGCRLIQIFSAADFVIASSAAPFHIQSDLDEQIEGLEILKLNRSVTSLPIDVDEVFPNLVSYHVTNCSIKEISLDYFRNLIVLESISLNGNEIETVRPDAFNHSTELRVLNLNDNRIYTFDEKVFAPLLKLEQFLIKKNFLENNVEIFRYCGHLKDIDLSYNGISEIRENIFVYFGTLQTLDLSGNEISFLNTANFIGKPDLMTVDLSGNVCIDKKYVGSNDTRLSTEEFNTMLNEIASCRTLETTTAQISFPTLP